jgi:hypothetical protein
VSSGVVRCDDDDDSDDGRFFALCLHAYHVMIAWGGLTRGAGGDASQTGTRPQAEPGAAASQGTVGPTPDSACGVRRGSSPCPALWEPLRAPPAPLPPASVGIIIAGGVRGGGAR